MSDAVPMAEDGREDGGGYPALITDLYELTMLQAYHAEGMAGDATFSLFFRRLPRSRNFVLAAGLEPVLEWLETLHFDEASLRYLQALGTFRPAFLDWLADFRFTGEVWAVPEGTPVFPGEPLLEITAPIGEAQVVETFVMNQIHHQSVIASKGARVVAAARGRPVIDFGMRRMHGIDAGLKGARALWIAGISATSNVQAGAVWGLPVAGTMAHSWVQAHEDELAAFRGFARLYPDTVLLVDTYDTLQGVRHVIELAKELGDAFGVRAIRIDSGDLDALSRTARGMLDEAGLSEVQIFVSGSLDEHDIDSLLGAGAPIDGFGVGTRLGIAEDAPTIDMAYKLTAYDGRGRFKTAPGKASLPWPKQIWRRYAGDRATGDTLARRDEVHPGEPLLERVMAGGERLRPAPDLGILRDHARAAIDALPEALRGLETAQGAWTVRLSPALANSAAVRGFAGDGEP